jgi:tripartite-type tricarboxylate transporter receptor subunit TctC
MRALILTVAALGLAGPGGAATAAETYPTKPLRVIVPTAPGGSPDTVARIVTERAATILGQPIVVDARGGGGGLVGASIAMNAAPDGYTLMMGTSTVLASQPALNKSLPYTDKHFIPLTRAAYVANVVTVNPGLGASNVAELVKLLKEKPGQLHYGSAGVATPAHLAGAMFNVLAGVKGVHVPYKGAAPAMIDMIGGQIQYFITSPIVALPHGKAGRIKILATTGAQRDPLIPELPTVAETVPGYEIVQWWGFVALGGTPKHIQKRMHEALTSALQTDEVKQKLARLGAQAMAESPAEFAAFIKAERARIARVGKEAGIVIN